MADVGDGHAQADPPSRERLHAHRVVEVTRRLAIDRDRRDLPQVLASGRLLGEHPLGHRAGLCLRVRRKLHEEPVLDRDDAELDVRVRRVAKDLGDPAEGPRLLRGIVRDLDDHDLPLAGVHVRAVLHRDRPEPFRVEGDHEAGALVALHAPDHALVRTLDDLDHGARRAPSAPVHAGQHPVPLDQALRRTRREVEVRSSLLLGNDEAESLLELLHLAGDHLALGGDLVVVPRLAQDEARFDHIGKEALDEPPLVGREIEVGEDRLQGDRVVVPLLQVVEDRDGCDHGPVPGARETLICRRALKQERGRRERPAGCAMEVGR